MNDKNKSNNLKEKLRQALNSTAKVISDDFYIKDNYEENKSSKNSDFFNLENLNSKNDFVRARADSDSSALKKNFLTIKFIKKINHIILHVNLFILLLKK